MSQKNSPQNPPNFPQVVSQVVSQEFIKQNEKREIMKTQEIIRRISDKSLPFLESRVTPVIKNGVYIPFHRSFL